jgi:O-methyltransferase involved in polyketide biosynthesis
MNTNSNDLLPISETMLIPLSARAAETYRDNPLIVDEKSAEIISKINTENKVIDGGNISTHGILARTKVTDNEVKNILAENSDATIINLGAGLYTTFMDGRATNPPRYGHWKRSIKEGGPLLFLSTLFLWKRIILMP